MNAQDGEEGVSGGRQEMAESKGKADAFEALVKQVMPLSIPVPPTLEKALGYDAGKRWVAFYCTPDGENVLGDDGFGTCGCQETAWQLFIHHPAVSPLVKDFHFGSNGQTAEHYLLLDRAARRLYVGELLPVMRLLAAQHAGPPSPEESLQRLLHGVSLMEREANTPPSPAKMRAWRDEQLQLEAEVVQWLDSYLSDQQTPESTEEDRTENPSGENAR